MCICTECIHSTVWSPINHYKSIVNTFCAIYFYFSLQFPSRKQTYRFTTAVNIMKLARGFKFSQCYPVHLKCFTVVRFCLLLLLLCGPGSIVCSFRKSHRFVWTSYLHQFIEMETWKCCEERHHQGGYKPRIRESEMIRLLLRCARLHQQCII